jgi:hypothetical protein
LNCTIPELVKRSVGSSLGMSDELEMTVWPLSLKYSINFALISLDVMYDSLLVLSRIIFLLPLSLDGRGQG